MFFELASLIWHSIPLELSQSWKILYADRTPIIFRSVYCLYLVCPDLFASRSSAPQTIEEGSTQNSPSPRWYRECRDYVVKDPFINPAVLAVPKITGQMTLDSDAWNKKSDLYSFMNVETEGTSLLATTSRLLNDMEQEFTKLPTQYWYVA